MMLHRIKKIIHKNFFKEFHPKKVSGINYSDISKKEWQIIEAVKPFTMTNPERIVNLCRAVEYIEANSIEGSVVECGVWKGGSIMAVLKILCKLNSFEREIYLYDTFEGMSEPTDKDESFRGESAINAYLSKNEVWKKIECLSQIEEVKKNVHSIGYPNSKIHFIEGKVEDTVPNDMTPDKISLLRLDTDWYESTLHEMEHLFPKLVTGGIIIIDDYGHWKGCREAVDGYISKYNINLFLIRVDYTCRIGVKM
ncbi:TylF/MycF/NovP-related O-methyltransferase [Salegentibacter maritimus]|uniref:Class I SAM-dependent methyltransferase n=1 Tax=Salegentibacter maritimus TaxID=2794347 RepID=A0ABS0TEU3_9FLAO|nr:TylF/MycF/NovP-related O-methyltransferase [Salegentibacter maritimus]MBI6118554.1 class I SAM-dependent methyltransferase [Salegentibacter maritimus]